MTINYKTLDELWKENGEKPIKVTQKDWVERGWFMALGKTHKEGFFCGYDDSGRSYIFSSDNKVWTLYQEPKKKVEHWAAICKLSVGNNEYYITNTLYTSEEDAKKNTSRFIQLDKSRPAIMLYPVEEEE